MCVRTQTYTNAHLQPCTDRQKEGQTSFQRHDMPIPLIKIYWEDEEEEVEAKIGIVGVERVEIEVEGVEIVVEGVVTEVGVVLS